MLIFMRMWYNKSDDGENFRDYPIRTGIIKVWDLLYKERIDHIKAWD